MRLLVSVLAVAAAVQAGEDLPVLHATVSSHQGFMHTIGEDYCRSRYTQPWTTGCSSSLPSDTGASYGVDNILDGDASTAWVEGAPGDGTGEFFYIQAPFFADYLPPEVIEENGVETRLFPIDQIVFYNGNQESTALWEAYGKPRLVWVPDTHAGTYSRAPLISAEIVTFLNSM